MFTIPWTEWSSGDHVNVYHPMNWPSNMIILLICWYNIAVFMSNKRLGRASMGRAGLVSAMHITFLGHHHSTQADKVTSYTMAYIWRVGCREMTKLPFAKFGHTFHTWWAAIINPFFSWFLEQDCVKEKLDNILELHNRHIWKLDKISYKIGYVVLIRRAG